MERLASIQKCTGCMSCYNACTHKAISMKENEEGFCYPFIDEIKCVQCGLCTKRCPELNNRETENKYIRPKIYAIVNPLDAKNSSSGGAFSFIARMILAEGGIVYGATMDANGIVYHTSIESIHELGKLQGSKYVQSYMGECLKEIRHYLLNGRKVLFVGTGCQVAGLYSYLSKKYEGLLYTIDLICHGVPSNKTFISYINKIRKKRNLGDAKLEEFGFRKLDGWAYCPSIKFTKSKKIYLENSENAFMNSFFKGILFRESCYHCSYCNTERIGTFTIGDFWGVGKHGISYKHDVGRGVSLLIDNKGLLSTFDLADIFIEERPFEEAIFEQDNLKSPMKRNPLRDIAIKNLMDPNISLELYCNRVHILNKKTILSRISIWIKHFLLNVGLFNLYKEIQYKYLK